MFGVGELREARGAASQLLPILMRRDVPINAAAANAVLHVSSKGLDARVVLATDERCSRRGPNAEDPPAWLTARPSHA